MLGSDFGGSAPKVVKGLKVVDAGRDTSEVTVVIVIYIFFVGGFLRFLRVREEPGRYGVWSLIYF